MTRWHKFPWRRLLAAIIVIVALFLVSDHDIRGETKYVIVDSTSKDAVVLDSPDWLGEPLAGLKTNQEIEALDETDGEYTKVRIKVRGRMTDGWVKTAVLRDKPLQTVDADAAAVEGAERSAQVGKGLNKEIENDMRNQSDEMDGWLKKVEKFEATRNKEIGGDPVKPDPEVQRDHYRKFGKDGKLIK